jgi:adenylate kinase
VQSDEELLLLEAIDIYGEAAAAAATAVTVSVVQLRSGAEKAATAMSEAV